MEDIAIDLGTENTLIHVRGRGLVLDEPSIISVAAGDRIVATGHEARRMVGRTPDGVSAVHPMRDGVIADVTRVEMMLRAYLARVVRRGLFRPRPRVVVGVPSGITDMERRAVRTAVLAAGAREVHLIAEPVAAAIGVGLPVTAAQGSMVVNVGGGTTEIGVLALSSLVAQVSIRMAGSAMDDAIVAGMRKHYSLYVGHATAEAMKREIASAVALEEERTTVATGRDLVTGIPASVTIGSAELRGWIQEPVRAIVEGALRALELAPPELAADLVDEGMVLTGGGSLVRGLDLLLARETGIPVRRDPEPMTCVVRGAGAVLDDWERYRETLSA